MMTTHTIGTIEDFPEGKGTAIDIDGRKIAVFNIDGELFAVQNNCPHKNLPLHLVGHERARSEKVDEEDGTRGRIYDGCKIDCPWHQAEWDLRTGYSPVVKKRIPTYEVRVEDHSVVIEM